MARKWEEREPGGHDFQVPWATENPRKSLILARLAGIEPTTLGFGEQTVLVCILHFKSVEEVKNQHFFTCKQGLGA